MHAPALTRTTLTRGIGLVLVIGLAASITLNVVMVVRSHDDRTRVAAARVTTTQPSHAMQLLVSAKEHQHDVSQASISPRTLTFDPLKGSKFDNQFRTQGQPGRHSSPVDDSRYVGSKFDQGDVLSLQADQKFAPTAVDRFIITTGS